MHDLDSNLTTIEFASFANLVTYDSCKYVFDSWSSFNLFLSLRPSANLFSVECLCYITSSPADQAVIDLKAQNGTI